MWVGEWVGLFVKGWLECAGWPSVNGTQTDRKGTYHLEGWGQMTREGRKDLAEILPEDSTEPASESNLIPSKPNQARPSLLRHNPSDLPLSLLPCLPSSLPPPSSPFLLLPVPLPSFHSTLFSSLLCPTPPCLDPEMLTASRRALLARAQARVPASAIASASQRRFAHKEIKFVCFF